MIPYILHVALLIATCLFFYKVLLRKETFYRLNRFVLISSLALAFLIPLVPIPAQWAFWKKQETVLTVTPVIYAPAAKSSPAAVTSTPIQPVKPEGTVSRVDWVDGTTKWIFYIYWTGVVVFGLNFLLQFLVLVYKAYLKPAIKDGRYRIVELTGDKAPCSFGNTIFINPAKYDWDTYNQILLHEKVHIRQRHSFDILLAELSIVFQWFNPFAWLYRKELENNLEFLTDDSVLHRDDIEKETYQMSLLKVSAPHFSLGLTTNYNQSLLKRRIAMMNAKQSNLNTMWKYFFLVPLIGCLMCALNETTAYGQTDQKKLAGAAKTEQKHVVSIDRSRGSWFATIKNDRLRITFKSDGDDHDWNSSSDFQLSEFSALPKDQAGEFTLTREAGAILFKGKFDGNKGYGDYQFTPNREYFDFLKKEGVSGIDEEDEMAFFLIDIRKDYVKMLQQNGFKNISKDELIPLAALKVDAAFIQMWKENGFPDLSSNDLVSTKALGIDKAYVADIRNAGYKTITLNQLISFKAQHVTGDYIKSLKSSKPGDGKNESGLPDPDEVSAYKALSIDGEFVKSFEALGFKNMDHGDLTALKSLNVTPEYIKSLRELGLNSDDVNKYIPMKSLGITPEYAGSFKKMGLSDISLDNLPALKSTGITPDYVKSIQALGFKNTNVDQYIPLKSLGITAEYIDGLQKAGFTRISLDDLPAIKSTGITIEYVKSIQALGFKSTDVNEYIPLKSLGITADYINGFKKLGFNDISLNDLPALKSMGVTPEFIASMQEKGIKLSSLEKYIQLKAAMN